MAGQLNKKELELLMGEITRSEPNITPEEYGKIKGMEEMKPRSYPFKFLKQAPSENQLMKLLEAGVNDTKKEGIMTAEQYKQGGDLNYIIEMMKNETDPDKLEELKSIIREMLGTSPYMSIRQDPVRKAADGGIMELAPGGSTEFDRVMELEKQYEKILSDYPELKETRKLGTFSTGGSFENFLEKLGFTKKENGKIRGSRSAAAAAIGVRPADFMNENRFASMAKLYNLAKEKGLRPKDYYIPKELAGYGLIQPTEELATGMKYGQGSAKIKQEFNEFIAATKKKASDQYGANPSGEDRAKKNIFIEKEIKAKFPNLKKGVGLATLTKLIASKALGAPLDILMPSEIASGELLTEDELAEMRIREKFQ